MMEQLKGTGVAIITPFTTDGEVDYNAYSTLIEFYIAEGIDYLVVLGTTGETATLTKEEKQKVAETVVQINAGRLPLVIGKGGNNTAALVEEIKTSSFDGFDAILSVCPFYNRPNQEGLFQHFAAVAEASPLPILLYNVPSRTGVSIANETVLRLANTYPLIIGIKDATGDIASGKELIQSTSPDFLVISGDDESALDLVLCGGVGIISVIGGGLPRLVSKMIQLGRERKTEEAQSLLNQIRLMIGLIFKEGNPTGVKSLLKHQNKCGNELRLPLVRASEALNIEIASAFSKI